MFRQKVQNVLRTVRIGTAQRNGGDLTAAVLHHVPNQLKRELAGAENKAGVEFLPAQDQRILFHGFHNKHLSLSYQILQTVSHPPPIKETTSMTSLSLSRTVA